MYTMPKKYKKKNITDGTGKPEGKSLLVSKQMAKWLAGRTDHCEIFADRRVAKKGGQRGSKENKEMVAGKPNEK